MSKVNETSAAGSLIGFQVPPENRRKIDACMEAFNLAENDRNMFFFRVDEQTIDSIVKSLDAGNMTEAGEKICEKIEENVIRAVIVERLKEVVRKKKGGGGYVLYSPNRGKKHPPKPVGDFPTKLQAKRAELQRFPPKDMAKLKRLRHEVDRLQKDPDKAKEKEKKWANPGMAKKIDADNKKKDTKKEGLREAVYRMINEALFNEEETQTSRWDERMSKLSKAAVEADKKLQGLQKNIEKKGQATIQNAFASITKALKPRKMSAKSSGVKKDSAQQKTFLQFMVDVDGVEVGPFYVFIDSGKPKVEISSEAKTKLMKIEPEKAKLLRAELITVQEGMLDSMDDVQDAISKRDSYLDKLESKVDDFVANLNALEISVLKNLLVQKYRGK